jgi:hypothetical protein
MGNGVMEWRCDGGLDWVFTTPLLHYSSARVKIVSQTHSPNTCRRNNTLNLWYGRADGSTASSYRSFCWMAEASSAGT